MIAFKEMVRAKARFGLLVGAIGLLLFLILFQQALRDGLITSFVGAIEQQSAPVLVFSTDGRRNLQSSSITPELEDRVRAVDGVGRVGRIGQSTFSVRAGGAITGAAVIGYERRDLGAPRRLVAGRYPAADGEGVANETDTSDGFTLGDVVRVEPGGYTIRIVGQTRDSNLQASPTIFTRYGTWEQTVKSVNPDAREPLPTQSADERTEAESEPEARRIARNIETVAPVHQRGEELRARSQFSSKSRPFARDSRRCDNDRSELPRAMLPLRKRAREEEETDRARHRQDARALRPAGRQHSPHEPEAVSHPGRHSRNDSEDANRESGQGKEPLGGKAPQRHAGRVQRHGDEGVR